LVGLGWQDDCPTEVPTLASIKFLMQLLDGRLPDFRVACFPRNSSTILVFSDASYSPGNNNDIGAGGVAFVVFLPESRKCTFAAATVPQEVLRKLT
jgi:hypothetical protein